MTVGATWGVLAVIAVLAGPVPAMLLSLIPLMMALRAALRADARGEPPSMEQALQRQVTAAAMLIAVGLFSATLWSLRDRVPRWAIPMEMGMLLHYWLLTLAAPDGQAK
jgi:1,4-dihydroxy-2-naphthoate octaprenyltransferase